MATQPSDYTEFPAEIILKPLALIGLSGLDTVNNAVHKTIWDAFSNNRRPDRAAVRFKLLNNTLEFPVAKPKRNSYEWYIPKGILKKNWINKRVALIPAAVVIFYDMEWEDPQWNEKIIECASRVQSVRAAVEGHSCRVAVVVLQAGPTPPPSESVLGAERAQALCAACQIQSKSLFVLPHNDHLIGYIVRLETAFYDIAQNYYHYETKMVKQHREHLNKTAHQYLFVRHQFKLGFLNELKQDLSTAHKHYLQAYNNLLESRTVDTTVHEVRTVAGYINYKLCHLLFALNLPRDAIAQLKTHIERYRSRTGPTELLFEHYAWIARQYSAFGELFDEAIRAGLPAIQSQHPGFYYQHAAQFTSKRRQAARSLCAEVNSYGGPPDPLAGSAEHYGQRAWRPGRLSAEPHEPSRERAAVQALQYNEKIFNHSAMIINFLGSAITQFKTFHSPRTRRRLVVEMADEYYLCGDYGKALTLLSHMLWDYRREQWWVLASHVLTRALQAAYLSAKIHDYLQLSVEALSKHILVPNNDKQRIFSNIMSVLNLNIPGPEPDLPAGANAKALEAWQLIIEKDPFNVIIDMANISSFIEVKPKFGQPKYRVDETVVIELFIRLSSVSSLIVKQAFVTVTGPTDTIELPVGDGAGCILQLDAGKVKRIVTNLKPNPLDNGSELRIKSVSLVLDNDRKRKIFMNFKMDETVSTDRHPELLHFILSPKCDYEFDCIVPVTTTTITARECKLELSVEHASPALQGEWFPTTFVITNNEDTHIYNVELSLCFLPPVDGAELRSPEPSPAQHLPHAGTLTDIFHIKSSRPQTANVQITITYNIDLPEIKNLQCVKEFVTKIPVVKPFEVTTNFVNMNFKTISKCFVDDPFIVMPHIKILSPWSLLIEDTELEVADCFRYADSERPPSSVAGVEVDQGSLASDAICIQAQYKDHPTRVGLYNIKWRRKGENISVVTSSTALSGLPAEVCPVAMRGSCPEKVQLQTCVPLRCSLSGLVDTPARLTLSVEGTDAYMFSGYKKLSVTVPPRGFVSLSYNLHPLTAGRTSPPRLRASLLDEGGQDAVRDMFDKSLPQHIFVMPKYNK